MVTLKKQVHVVVLVCCFVHYLIAILTIIINVDIFNYKEKVGVSKMLNGHVYKLVSTVIKNS